MTQLSRRERLALVAGLAILIAGCGPAATNASPARSARLTYVALGDSIPFGEDCGGCTGYVTLYARRVERALGAQVTVHNRAEHNNLNSRQLADQIRHSSALRADIAGAEIITLTIGHNDAPWNASDDPCDGPVTDDDPSSVNWQGYTGPCSATLAKQTVENVRAILREVRALRSGKPTIIRATNFHNDNYGDPLVQPVAYGPTKVVVDRMSAAICGAAEHEGQRCADVYHAFNGPRGKRFDGPYVAEDHVHPNQRGHQLIAMLLARQGYAPLAP